jgi:hypothetical protein
VPVVEAAARGAEVVDAGALVALPEPFEGFLGWWGEGESDLRGGSCRFGCWAGGSGDGDLRGEWRGREGEVRGAEGGGCW